ncbi:hypothetical protein DESC_590104 [Desulfosarcina cetonica]|nr:hypothetical protein DESC_590104 [Desulfosarcina cetonica]
MVHENAVGRIDGDQNRGLVLHRRRGGRGAIDIDSGLLGKTGVDQKKNQQNEHHIDERRDVQFRGRPVSTAGGRNVEHGLAPI